MSRSIRRLAGSLLRKPILVTHIRTVLRTYSRKVLILISAGSWWEARRLDIGLNLHHQALLLLYVNARIEGSDEMLFNNICMLLRCSHMQLVRLYKYGSDHHCKSLCMFII